MFKFRRDIALDVIRLSYDQQTAYDKWKTDQISDYARGKESDDIIKRFGKPDFRTKEKASRPVKQGSETVNVDETFDYCILDGQGVRLGFSKGKCVDTDCFSNSQ